MDETHKDYWQANFCRKIIINTKDKKIYIKKIMIVLGTILKP